MELFSEIYGVYYNAISKVLAAANKQALTEKEITKIINNNCFGESFLYILPKLIKDKDWLLLSDSENGYKSVLKHNPTLPLSNIQKSWLKSLLQDKRLRLFVDDTTLKDLEIALKDITPLFKLDDFHYFDIINDGDPYDMAEYIQIFRTILFALQNNRKLKIEFESGKGLRHSRYYVPYKLEYSIKDDKFRLLTIYVKDGHLKDFSTINLARIKSAELASEFDISIDIDTFAKKAKCIEPVVVEILNHRNALERAMLHFCNYDKRSEQIGDTNKYKMEISYYTSDQTELLIRILSFGPLIKVISPVSFVNLVKERLEWQDEIMRATK